ncbi:MAG: TlpA disulfide reductase family protein, partial [Kiritimatiellae bacterium]|nr:TlpA disulfide reductase family protein [Kiritimatiellia bacterium]
PQGVTRLIYEFQNSPAYDGAPFQYSGGETRDQPLKIVRPNARGSASITVTAMEQLRKQAQTGKDRPLESIPVLDDRGREYDLSRLPWKVTLIDFWMGAWVPWRGTIPYMVDAYEEYQDQGFGILGISLDDDPSAGLAMLRAVQATWPQASGQGRAVAREFGYYGEASNVLVDERGFVLARNIRGPDLGALVRKALNLPEGSWDHE